MNEDHNTVKSAPSPTSAGCEDRKLESVGVARASTDMNTPITAIGASAGGLEPIEQFFDAMPVDSGCAFVIIQHLSPDFRSLMDELLARHSSMKIHRIEDGMQIEPNSIYLNTPRTVMTIHGNQLKVEQIDPKEMVYLPIDIFFKSLAEDRGAEAIGLVLSGTGSDGTKGSRLIYKAGGRVLVQDPKTTKFDSMPRSVIAEGSHSAIATPAALADSVQLLLNNESLEEMSAPKRKRIVDPLSDVLSMLKHSHGTDFLQYKEATVQRRIERRAQMRGITDINDYRDYLNTDKDELSELYADLLIEVTEFFRDEAAFELLKSKVIPALTENLKDGGGLRIWVPGCASGEEAYSIAILLQEEARSKGVYWHIKIMATDIHVRSMSQASSGVYNEASLRNVPTELIEQYFDCADGQAQIKPNLRNMVFFSTHDVTRDPPFTRIDLVSCRNLMIYLKDAAQEKVLSLLHFALRKDGYLFLGPSEHIGKISHEFDAVSDKWRIYKKRRDIKLLAVESIFHGNSVSPDVAIGHSLHRGSKPTTTYNDDTIPFKRAHNAALEAIVARHAPPGFLLTDDGTIVHIFGNAGELIPLQAGSFSKRISDLIVPELKVVVTAALDHARNKEFNGFKRTAYVKPDNLPASTYNISLSAMALPNEAVTFRLLTIEKNNIVNPGEDNQTEISNEEIQAVNQSDILQQRISMLEHNLQSSEESLQSTIEELETSNEELQSTNEELMSANEEMQSTNEELHSVNEELYTVSAEHQRKNDELTERETDINVLLKSSKIGTVHLDENMCLRRYTNNALNVFNILPQDIGRPINHITVKAQNQDILGMVYSARQDQKTHEAQVAVGRNVYLLRIMPYKSAEHHGSGVLITVIDITDSEQIRSQLDDINTQYRDIVDNTDSFVVRWDAKTNEIVYCNDPYARRWNKPPKELIGKNIITLRAPDDQIKFRKRLEEQIPDEVTTGIYDITYADGKLSYVNIITRAISSDGKTIDYYQSSGFDVTSEYSYRNALEKLFSIISDEQPTFVQKLDQILQTGLEYFALDTGIISTVLGDIYEVVRVIGENPASLKCGTRLKLEDTICSTFIENGKSLAVDNLSDSDLDELPCHKNTEIESFVGACINMADGPYGSVSFSSLKPRGRSFTQQEEYLCMLIGSWVGFLIGNQEQLDFMKNQNHYYNSVFLTVPTMMFLCDADGLITSASNRLCEKLGLEPESVPGKICHQLFKTDTPDTLTTTIMKGTAQRVPISFNLPDNGLLETELNCTIKPDGTLKGVRMVVLTDVSDRNNVLRKVEEQNLRLESANENLNQFAFIASHDLQEPLRKIQQFSNFLEEDLQGSLSGDAKYHLDVIVDASERMSTLIYDLLRYSGASQQEPVKESVSLEKLLKEVEEELALSVAEIDATLDIGALPDVLGDETLLRQLFLNLIGNSLKYRAKDKKTIVSIKAFGGSGSGGIDVIDNGIGFEMDFATKIFEPFNRLHNNDEYKGNGIGLAICKKFCEKHGWTLTGDSTPGEGSKFTISFSEI